MDQTKFCQNCGAPMKYSQRLGRFYCSALCWKNKPQTPQTFQKAVPSQPSALVKVLTEIKDELKEIKAWMKEIESRSVIYPSREDINASRRELGPEGEPPEEETEEKPEEEL